MSFRRCRAGPAPGRERGAALVIALMVFGICAALIVAMKSDFELFYQRGANSFLAEQNYAYLRGAEDLAAIALVVDYESDQARGDAGKARDDLSEIWAQPPEPYPLDDGGVLQGHLEDLEGRFNLNNLAAAPGVGGEGGEGGEAGEGVAGEEGADGAGGGNPTAQRYTPYQAQFIRLLQSFEEPVLSQQEAVMVMESIRDWLDADNQSRMYGAEDDYYFGQTPSYRAANRPLASVSELRAVANITPELYRALAPWVTVWPQEGGTLNIHTAPAQVLRSLNADDDLTPLDPGIAEALASQREELPFEDIADFLSQPVFAERPVTNLQSVLGETSDWFLMSARVQVADRSAHLYSVLHRSQRQVEAVARSSGEL